MSQIDIKNIVTQIFNDSPKKIKLIDSTLITINKLIDGTTINKLKSDIKNIITITESKNEKSVDIVEIITILPKIISNLYNFLEDAKSNQMLNYERKFIKNNIDLISQVVLILSLKELLEKKYVDEKSLIKILRSVKVIISLKIDMSKSFSFCI